MDAKTLLRNIIREIENRKIPYQKNPQLYPDAGWQKENHGNRRFCQGLQASIAIIRSQFPNA